MSPDRFDLAERMGRAARELQRQPDFETVVAAAARLAVSNVSNCDVAAVSMVDRRRRIETQAYTDEAALSGDLLQYALGEGPCLDAVWEEQVVHSSDLSSDPRWREWGPRVAAQHGLHSVLCLQLYTSSDHLGALNLYSRSPGAFDPQDRDEGQALAAHVAVAIAGARTADQLTRALDSRTLVGQAVGIVMERYRLDPGAAFGVLARVSSETNVKVRDIAQELVETGQLHATGDH